MNIIKKLYCRIFQITFRIALPILPYRNPKILNKLEEIVPVLSQNKVKKPMLVTDKNLSAIGACESVKEVLARFGVSYAYFDGCYPNPTTDLVAEVAKFYRDNGCDGMIAYGGGSPMDLAKATLVSVVKPNKPLGKMAGILKVRKRLPLLIAIPTTAGTGSETTLAAVIIDSKTRHKYAINDFPLIPRYAVLDARTIHSLPKSVASSTGIDALTHAVEAYIGRSTTRQTREDAETAVKLIFENLDGAVNHESVQAESAMLQAAHLAGRAFTRSYVGYIHAVSHSLSGKYNFPHGWTNAVLLPLVLKHYGEKAYKKLAKLSRIASVANEGDCDEVEAKKFISAIEEMNRRYDIPEKIDGIKEEDISALAQYADKEANPLYPVPVLWNAKELEVIYREVMSNGKN